MCACDKVKWQVKIEHLAAVVLLLAMLARIYNYKFNGEAL